MKNRKKLLIVSLIIVVTLIAVTIGLLFLSTGRGILDVAVFPTDTNYTINGHTYTGNQKILLDSGQKDVIFSRDLYQKQTVRTKIKKGETTKIDVTMDVSQDIKNGYGSLLNPGQKKVDQNEQALYQKEQDIFNKRNPIAAYLPIIKKDYRIDYGFYNESDPMEITIKITLFAESINGSNATQLQNDALNEIKQYGIDRSKIRWETKSKSDF